MLKHIMFFTLLFFLLSCSSEKSKPAKNNWDAVLEDEMVQNEEIEFVIENEVEEDIYAEKEEAITIKNKEEIHFTELWIWEYLNETKEWEELWVYREPKKNYWLFESSSSFGMTDEMCEWVLAKPNGEYWLSYQSPEMNTPNTLQQQQIEFEKAKSLPGFWKSTGKKKEFGDTVHSWSKFEGEEFEVFYKGQQKPSTFYLVKENIDLTAVYYFNLLEGNIQLPIIFPTDIPSEFIVLSEKTDFEMQDIAIRYRFKEISPTSYYAYLPKQ
ncbi:MAG TPA: hypothetical protein VK021_01625 [Flavobacteriaceae bacterium]|nr:hypothetical protein [Flavobacteriaceae bacterium]